MKFFPKKRRSPPGVIIVALIDVLIVVLIFLLVTTTFKQQPAVKLALPEVSKGQQKGSSELAPLVLTIDTEGALYIGSSQAPSSLEELKQQLGNLVAGNPELRIALASDKGTPFGAIIQVMDIIKKSGVKTSINAFTRESSE